MLIIMQIDQYVWSLFAVHVCVYLYDGLYVGICICKYVFIYMIHVCVCMCAFTCMMVLM